MDIGIFVLVFAYFIKATNGLHVSFEPPFVEDLHMGSSINVSVVMTEFDFHEYKNLTTAAEPQDILQARLFEDSFTCDDVFCNGTIEVRGRFLGFGSVFLLLKNSTSWNRLSPSLPVTVLREDKILNKIFIAFVAVVVSINYINMGCALDITVVKNVLKRPVGPAVGLVCQFVVMPLVSYGVGLLLFDDPVLRLGLFTFGSSPGGGASNMWTLLLGGNLNLSIAMTFLSTLAAFGTLPLWLFTLGKTIVEGSTIKIPFTNILTSLASLAVPIGVGLLVQRYLPKLAAVSKKILAPVSIVIIICIIILASVANTYIFFLLSWPIIFAASLSVWSGFLAGILVSFAFRFPQEDMIAVAVETGIQNTGIAFLMLSYSLKPPVSDIAAVVPVAGSIITPLPLFVIYCVQKIRNCCFRSDTFELQSIHSKKEEYDSTNKGMENMAADSDVNY
ncbi:ileal sodium/bile acid cotransporter-like [Uloborus diversus]|uniref:ileal sodium/bile acid cotransporter-like n=1 Tax=Uloborus diversus TaxID=327109 RepID=UPI0024092043|nr:ileal sodium/bile acid cotransporter-like [Uloborus diversus]